MTPSFHVIHPPAWMANYQMGFQPSSGDFDLRGRGGPPTVAVGGLLDGGALRHRCPFMFLPKEELQVQEQ